MKSNVVPFTRLKVEQKDKVLGYRVSFYTEKEIELTLLCVNHYGTSIQKYDRSMLKSLDPRFIVRCLELALSNRLFSAENASIIKNILRNFEEVVDAAI